MTKELTAKEQLEKLEIENALHHTDSSVLTKGRRFYSLLPSDPRCISCMSPFEGIGGFLVKTFLHKERAKMNPLMCNQCEELVKRLEYGTEVEMTMLFADIRGSTTLAENMTPTEFKELIDRFYSKTSHVLYHSLAIVDKLVGDEISGYFLPAFTGADYISKAIQAAKDMLAATGHNSPGGPWAPVGVGIHSGKAYFGAVTSTDGLVELTALGDPVNTTSRLTSQAGAGEIVISDVTVLKAGLDTSGMEKRTLTLKGKSAPMDVWVVHPSLK